MEKTSNYKGVYWDKQCSKYKAKFIHKGVAYNCGTADSEIESVKLRDLLIIRKGFPIKHLQIIKPSERPNNRSDKK